MGTENSEHSGFDTRKYRNTLGCFTTGVCLISTLDNQGRARAMTANSFTSVSLAPPIILWCIDRSSERFDLFNSAETFSVNILRGDEGDTSKHFAKHVDAELTGDDLIYSDAGLPRYSRALAWLDCQMGWRQQAGDHVVIFGKVVDFGSESGDALGFFRGGYSNIPDVRG